MSQPFPPLGEIYRIRSKATGHELSPTLGSDNHVRPVGPNWGAYWKLEAVDIGYRLDCAEEILDSNAERQVYTLPWNGGSYQKWRIVEAGEGYWSLINLATGLALDGTSEDIYTMRPNDGDYQRWRFMTSSEFDP
jgi:serine/threonine-protein kinase